jgi:hypothetical protein
VLSHNEDPDFGAPVASTEWTVILPDDIDAARVDDPGRSNLAASAEGAEQLIATYQEMLSLVSVAAEAKSRNNLRQYGRAANNLKQMGRAIVQDSSGSMLPTTIDERQSRQLAELQQKWLAAQREIEVLKEGRNASSNETVPENGIITRQDLQREVITNNTIDFVPESKSGETDDLRIELDASESDKKAAAGKPASNAAARRKFAKNRAELKGETAEQSINLNGVLAQQQQRSIPEESARPTRPLLKPFLRMDGQPVQQPADSDADEVLDFFEDERYSKVPIVDQSHDESRRARDGQKREAIRPNRRAGRKRAGVPIQSKPTFIGELFAQQEGFDIVGRADLGAKRDVDRDGDGVAAWTQPGGLSLEIAIPQAGQKLTFSKPGGDARLALGLRPRASQEAGLGLVWTVVWLIVALGLIAALGRHDAPLVLQRRLPLGLTIVGLLWYFLLPAAALGFVLFVLGLGGLAWQYRRA